MIHLQLLQFRQLSTRQYCCVKFRPMRSISVSTVDVVLLFLLSLYCYLYINVVAAICKQRRLCNRHEWGKHLRTRV
jgi:hypothetical protein